MHNASCETTFPAAVPDRPTCKPVQVARVVSVEALPTSDKLYKTRVQVSGGEERQVMHHSASVHKMQAFRQQSLRT
jgi:tRNA-binding EMAP/Myf-like protein